MEPTLVQRQTRFPRIVRRDHAHSPGQLEYVRIAIILAVLTSIEVGIYYLDVSHVMLGVSLVVLASIKFGTVAAFFMHLKFDGRLLTFLFVSGIALAFSVFAVAIITLHATTSPPGT